MTIHNAVWALVTVMVSSVISSGLILGLVYLMGGAC